MKRRKSEVTTTAKGLVFKKHSTPPVVVVALFKLLFGLISIENSEEKDAERAK